MTIAIIIKDIMANMPDTFKTKKQIDEYYKEAMKKCIEKSKQDIADKPKKELTGYQKFVKDNSKNIKKEYPHLTGPQVFSKIAEMWKIQKETIVPNEESEDKKEEDKEEIKDEEVIKEVNEEVLPVVVKDGKKKKK